MDKRKTEKADSVWLSVINTENLKKAGIWGVLIAVVVVAGKALLEDTAKKTLAPIGSQISEFIHARWDDWDCQGRAAMAEGDRLSGLAAKESSRAQALFKEANPHYVKAYGCGFPDAGIRLAVAHCMGLGTAKDPLKARQYILEIEGKHPEKIGRAGDVRKACGL